MTRLVRTAALLCLTLLLAACQTVPQAANMKVDDYIAADQRPEKVALEVEGGWNLPGQITNAQFVLAVEQSLVASKLFSRLVQIDDSEYRLNVVLGDVRQPPGGFNMTTEMTVLWSLLATQTKEVVWQELVSSTYTSTVGDAFAGAVRMRLSAEGAARENIRKALALLAQATL